MNLSELLRAIKPYVIGWMSDRGIGPGPYAPTPHDLSGAHHTSSITDAQGPQFLLSNGSRPLTGDMQVANEITIDGVDLSELADDFNGHAHAAQVLFTIDGTVAVHTGKHRVYNRLGRDVTLSEAWLAVDTAPTGDSLDVDVNLDGTSIGTVSIADGQHTGTAAFDDVWAAGHYLTVDIDQVGSTIAGADLVAHLTYQ